MKIISRPPTTDTYSAEVTQEEFFFKIPFQTLDTVWSAYEKGLSDAEISDCCGLEVDYIARIRSDLQQKQQTTQYLRLPPLEILYSRNNSSIEE
jgi:NAD+ synthase